MQRAALFTLLAVPLLLAAPLQAQRGGGAMRGDGGRGAPVSSVGGRSGARSGSSGNPRNRNYRNNYRNNAVLYPLWDDEPFEYGEPAPPEEFVPPPMMGHGGYSQHAAARPPADPKITELPGTVDAAASKPLPPALFILTSGERIEARQYLVTYDRVHLMVDHQQRLIPLAMIDIKATLAADRQRGIDLRIPAGQSEISLGF